jgi:hypothetical protein
MTRFSTTEVFTPSTVARLTFVERDELNKRLVNALRTPGKQIVVYGRSGGGKTTLLENKLQQTYERHVKSQCVARTSFNELLLSAFDQLEPFFVEEKSASSTRTSALAVETQSTALKVAEVKARLGWSRESKTEVKSRRAIPPQLSPGLLTQMLGAANACWVIEDLHKASKRTQRLVAQTMKLFMDAADSMPDVKIIVIGAVGSARDIVQLDPEMWNRVSEIEVDLMEPSEIEEIIALGEQRLDVQFPSNVKNQIVHYANGLAAVCHQLCLNMCMEADIVETCEETHHFLPEAFGKALSTWLADATDSLRQTYDTATRTARARRYDNCRIIVHALAALPRDGGTHAEILSKIREDFPDYPASNLSSYLPQLQSSDRGEVILHDVPSGRYYFASPMLSAYSRAIARQTVEKKQNQLFPPDSSHGFFLSFAKELQDDMKADFVFDSTFVDFIKESKATKISVWMPESRKRNRR